MTQPTDIRRDGPRPLLLDLFSCAGGAGVGYARAGFIVHGRFYDGPYVAAYGNGGGKPTIPQLQAAMGITWTAVREELTEAIPPAYTELIGRAFLASRTLEVAA